MDEEIWKEVKGYEGIYKISNYGNVVNIKTGKILKHIDIKGYMCVYLYKNKKKKKHYIHRLVGENFIPNLNNLPEINHKDENKKNNYVENLEWCSKLYNANYGSRKERISEKSRKTKVAQYSIDGKLIKEFNSIIEACNELNLRSSGISNCCANRYSQSGGYIWRYCKNES